MLNPTAPSWLSDKRIAAARYRRGSTGDGGLAILAQDGALLHDVVPEVASCLRHLITRLHVHQKDSVPPRLGVTSALSGEGVSSVSLSIAALLSHDLEARTCFVDLNWHRPSTLDDNPGLAGVLRNEAALGDVVASTVDPLLCLVPAGTAGPGESPRFATSTALRSTLDELGDRFDHLVIDLPPVLAAPDAVSLAALSDSFVLVIRHGATTTGQVAAALDELGALPCIGAVINRMSSRIPRSILGRLAPW